MQKSIDGKKRELDSLRPLDPVILKKLEDQFSIEWTYNSNAIEGNTISLGETELVLKQGITIGKKTLKEHFEVLNHDKAIRELKDFVQKRTPLSSDIIRDFHRLILSGIDDAHAGCFRKSNVRILGSYHLPPRSEKIECMIDEMIEFYHINRYTMHPVELAAKMHYYLVYIHPFIDGNGRTARLLMNMILMEAGYPPAIILNLDRKRYLSSLNEADRGHFEKYMDFMAKSSERSLILYIDAGTISSESKQNAEYITLAEASEICPYSQEYLSLLARKNMLGCVKFGRIWMTTKEAVDDYMKSRQRGEEK